jgi:hypothetical protein
MIPVLRRWRRRAILRLVGGPEVVAPPHTNFFEPLDEDDVRVLEQMAFVKSFEFGWLFHAAGQTERMLHAGAETRALHVRAARALRALARKFEQDPYTQGVRARQEYMDLLIERLLDRMEAAATDPRKAA